MYNDVITLFNRKESRSGDTWYPTVIRNAELNVDKAAILAKYGPEAQDRAVLHVRYKRDGENKKVAGKPWKPPKEWDKLLAPGKAVTFTDGTRFDFFWVGEWEGTEPILDNDYIASTDFYSYMNDKYDYVFAITSVGGPYSLIPHFEITGR